VVGLHASLSFPDQVVSGCADSMSVTLSLTVCQDVLQPCLQQQGVRVGVSVLCARFVAVSVLVPLVLGLYLSGDPFLTRQCVRFVVLTVCPRVLLSLLGVHSCSLDKRCEGTAPLEWCAGRLARFGVCWCGGW
jgi:hypothetical protein